MCTSRVSLRRDQVSMLFVNKVNPAGRPLYGLTLGRVGPIDLSKQNSKATWNCADVRLQDQ
jgi:hypothetical protein